MRGRVALLLLVAAAFPSAGVMAAPKKIVVLAPTPPAAWAAVGKAIGVQLEQQGLVADSDFSLEVLSSAGDVARLPAMAKQAVRDGADVIITSSYPAVHAAKMASSTIPIVVFNAGEPVETGLAASLANPGGNLTGISDMSSELSRKRLQLLQETVPKLRRVAILYNADDAGALSRYRAAAAAARSLGLTPQPFGVHEPDDFATVFTSMAHDRPDGLLTISDLLTLSSRKPVIDFASAHHIPAIYELAQFAEDGGLMSYGPSDDEMIEGVADLVARILKGERPADLPFEQPSSFELVVNGDTAAAMGLRPPASVLAQADKLIE